jgi:thioredoxin 1
LTKQYSRFFVVAAAFLSFGTSCMEASQPKDNAPSGTAVPKLKSAESAVKSSQSWLGVQKLNENQFEEKVLASSGITVVDFSATWCGPCRKLEPILHSIARKYENRVNFANIDVDESPNLSEELQIQNIPYIVFYKNGELKQSLVGFQSEEALKAKIEELLQ